METNEIMNNEEVIETTAEKVAEVSSNDSLKVVAGVGLGIFIGMLAYKYAVIPATAKLKAYCDNKKTTKQQDLKDEVVEGEYVELENE